MTEINALYPAPPQPQQQQGLLQQNPLALIPAIGQIQEFTARQNIGEAYRRNTKPDGTMDQQGLMRDLATTGGFKAGEAVGQGISNQSALIEQKNKQAAVMNDVIGSLPPNASTDEVISRLTWISTHYPPDVMPPALINQAIRDLSNPASRRQRILEARDRAMGVAGVAKEAQTGIDPRTGEIIAGTEQQRQRQLAGAGGGTMAPGAVRGAPGIAKTLPVGQAESMAGVAGQSASAANRLTEANDTSMTRKSMLGNLEDDLRSFTAGPGADWTKFAKAWVNRNVPLPKGWEFDPKSIASQEQFNKQAAMLAQQQFAAIGGTGTDSKFESAFTTSPNETLSQLGNKGIIRLLKGNEDAIQAKNKAWRQFLKGGGTPDKYAEFSDNFNSKFDPRAFQFKYMPKEERQSYIENMDIAERNRFLHDLTHARKQGWVSFEAPK